MVVCFLNNEPGQDMFGSASHSAALENRGLPISKAGTNQYFIKWYIFTNSFFPLSFCASSSYLIGIYWVLLLKDGVQRGSSHLLKWLEPLWTPVCFYCWHQGWINESSDSAWLWKMNALSWSSKGLMGLVRPHSWDMKPCVSSVSTIKWFTPAINIDLWINPENKKT